VQPPPAQLTQTQLRTLLSWTNGTSLTRVFASSTGNFTKADFFKRVKGVNRTLYVAETLNGTIFGGYYAGGINTYQCS
jgi:hypothetical protein